MKLKTGDRFVFHNSKTNRANNDYADITLGKIYTVKNVDWNGEAYFIDDNGDDNYALTGGVKYTKIVD